MFKPALERILNGCEDALAVVIMGFDGIIVDSVEEGLQTDLQSFAGEFSFVLNQMVKVAESLEWGALDETVINSDKFAFVVRVLSSEYFLTLVTKADGNLGKGRFLMRLALPDLRAEI
jgi:predicted regulator of Ras-like GTPase activity (Roadblock/LC7/MglB family)